MEQVTSNFLSTGLQLINIERQKQIEYFPPLEHDIAYGRGELIEAALCYATPETNRLYKQHGLTPEGWPWPRNWWKPGSRLRELAKAGALIAAEMDRIIAMGENK